ncbi:PREDICTED: condensin-2 complex subunit D3-like [Ceratosolen solmsi marchali]|uniref:Condensin-2 complex subunit D3-like n=1 Tax=Ceratosolen solmsi marchali TaxID=326594 RepID=A0AAJ6YRC7_9HYME|nr:PREDICTED: condensin-2 complex subunit D3-like [Ceratosolen solmsi marchali]
MDPLQIFENFKLDTLDEKWSDEVWQKEFMSFPEPPADYSILLGSEDMEAYLKEAYSAVKNWILHNTIKDNVNDQDRVEVSWQTFIALNINIRGLLAILGYLIKTGQNVGADEDSRQACLSSTSLYFTLLSIPGSSTFHVFHPNLYQWAIETLKLSELLVVHKKNHRINDLESLYANDQNEGILQSEKITLVKGLNSILFDLITMLKTFYMKYQVRSLEITVLCLVEVTKLETEVNHFQTYHNKMMIKASKTSLSFNAYVALQDLCDTRHGGIEDTIRLIMKYLMPHFYPNYLDLPSKAANIVWETIIYFLKKLLISKGSYAELGMKTLIQHLLVKCPDRAEARQKQATVISKLISICEGDTFLKSIENLIKFAHHNRIPYRIFAQEVIGKLLLEMPINESDDETHIREKTKLILIATTLSRCIDFSSMVRGKAMSIIESIVNSKVFTVKDFLNTLEQDKPFPTETILLRGLITDLNPFPGSETFNSVLLDRIKDERALVRRSATHLFENLVMNFPVLLHSVAPIISQHCRDPTLIVRRDAIHVLASLLQSNPFDEKVIHEYVRAVLPRIFDVETKVQEKVLESLQNLVLNRIKSFNVKVNDEIDRLPWKIIRKIAEEKMRKNLSKVCDNWVKNGVITNFLINRIQSHVGTENDTEVWILLSSLSEHVDLKNMKKYFENYKEILESNDFVTTLKLEVLRYMWQTMGKEYLENLYAYLYKSLCNFDIGLESISMCIDILGGITKYLHTSTGDEVMHSHVIDLIRLSEAQIEQLTEEDEHIEEETINIYLKAMSILGHASLLCSESVSESTLHIIQSLLLDCDSIKTPISCIERFKAAGIVLLGQQAMRDREIAEQIMPILGRLMCRSNTSESLVQAAIRVNAVKALADLCVRFTALVEPYLPDMCISMKDANVMVREAIVVIFVQLLLEDYIKVKGAFFYHILTMLSDNDETIRELTVFLIKERLLVKNKTLISQSFVRSLFHYNNCKTRHTFNDRKIRKKERDALTLPGQKNEAKRWMIYDFMLEHLDPPNKLKILIKLNSEILEGICEKSIDIKHTEGACVLKDVIYIISNDRMQASFGSKMQDEDYQDENTAVLENPSGNAINVIIEGTKKFKFKVMLQTLIKLRQFLTNCKSPLLVDVSKFLIKIISEFNKDQVAEIFDEHPELKIEIDQDISTCRKRSEADDSGSLEKHVSVDKDVTEENENYPLKKRDLNANVSTKNNFKKHKSSATTSKKLQDIQLTTLPRIVLRRLSTLTYPGIKEWKSPPRETTISPNSNAEPSSSGITVSSKSSIQNINSSSDVLEPESTNKPKPNN